MECPVAGAEHGPIDEGDGPVDLLVNLVNHLYQEDVDYLQAKCYALLGILLPDRTKATRPVR